MVNMGENIFFNCNFFYFDILNLFYNFTTSKMKIISCNYITLIEELWERK